MFRGDLHCSFIGLAGIFCHNNEQFAFLPVQRHIGTIIDNRCDAVLCNAVIQCLVCLCKRIYSFRDPEQSLLQRQYPTGTFIQPIFREHTVPVVL